AGLAEREPAEREVERVAVRRRSGLAGAEVLQEDVEAHRLTSRRPQPSDVDASMLARWIRREVARKATSRSGSSSSGSVRQRSRAVSSSSRIRSIDSRCPFCWWQAFNASPSTPKVSAWRVQSSVVAIERYW